MSADDRTTAYDLSNAELVQLFVVWQRKTQLSIRKHMPATVVSYNPTTQTVACTVDHLEIERVVGVPGCDTNNLTQPRPPLVLPGIPVVFAGSGDGLAYLTFPIVPGSTGMLAVMDRDLATWLTRQAQLPVDPVASGLHPVSSCVFFPGMLDNAHRISTPTDLTAAVLEHPTAIRLGAQATQSVAIAETLIAAVDSMLAALVAAGAGPAFTGAATAQTAWNTLKNTIASAKVKVAP